MRTPKSAAMSAVSILDATKSSVTHMSKVVQCLGDHVCSAHRIISVLASPISEMRRTHLVPNELVSLGGGGLVKVPSTLLFVMIDV